MSANILQTVTTACNVATLVLLGTAALAAVGQLRHVRAGNALAAVLAIERRFRDSDVQRALQYVDRELARQLELPHYRSELVARGYIDPKRHPEMVVCNWFNDIGTMLAGDFVDERLVLESYGRLIEYYWHILVPVIALVRRERGSEQYAGFEYLAYRAQRHNANRNVHRRVRAMPPLPLDDPWREIDRETAGVDLDRSEPV